MMTRSIVGRFLILAVLLVSLGVIAQAALIITRGPGKAIAKVNAAPSSAVPAAAMAAAAAAPQAPATDAPAQQADAAPVRVVYPGPLGDAPVQPRKFAAAAPSMPVAPQAVAPAPAAQASPPSAPAPAAAAAAPAVAAAPAPARPSPVVVASADADTQPAADPVAAAGKGSVNLNSASIDALNHLGGGHIGQTIVKHRPYGSVEDLVRKRVVRRSVYEQIKDQVAAQ